MKEIDGSKLKIDEYPVWSPTRLDLAELCMKAYWFQYGLRLKHPISSSTARGKLFHRMLQNFWKIDKKTEKLVQGYKSYESFINSAVRDWKFQYAKTGKSGGQKIEWDDYDCNGWGPALIGNIAETAGMVYSRYIVEEPRLEAEFEIQAEYEGFKLKTILDELREGLVIRDHKSGRGKHGEHWSLHRVTR